MKNYLFRAVLLLLCLSACQRDQDPAPYQPYPGTYLRANLNGADWQSQFDQYGWMMESYAYESPATPSLTCAVAYHWVSLQQVSRWGSTRSAFSIQVYQFSPKRYSLIQADPLGKINSCAPYAIFSTLEGDAGTGTFKLKPEADNHLTIEKFDPEQRFIEGTFQMTFVPDNVSKYSFFSSTDTLRFTEGRFRARIRQKTDPDWGQ